MLSYYAILMGDLVKSSENANVKKLTHEFHQATSAANALFKKRLLSPLTVTLGDEFQGLVTSLVDGWNITMELNRRFKKPGIVCRFALGLGEIHTPINRKMAWGMLGPGLTKVRQVLSKKGDANRYRFILPEPLTEALLNPIGLALTEVEGMWTDRQFQVVQMSWEQKLTADKILARKLGFSKTALYKHRRAAHYPLYVKLHAAVETALHSFDQKYIKASK